MIHNLSKDKEKNEELYSYFEIWPFQMFKEYVIECNSTVDNFNFLKYMNCIESHYRKYYNRSGCEKCNDTGCIPVFCCHGYECGCMGMPIDFVLSCNKCGIRVYLKFKDEEMVNGNQS